MEVIQRIQTVYLVLSVLLLAGVFFTELFDRVLADPQGWIMSGFVAAIAFSASFSGWAVTQYRNRPKQASATFKAVLFTLIGLGAGVAVFFTMGPINSTHFGELLGVVLLTLAALFQMLARRSILKDEELVKSVDRLR